ncbi:replication initiator A domain-containing protein [Roseburia inulinivorans]|uniref:Replication initiator A domain-containing protein n=2 Tax=Lachnospiraceae TaxID=186803 RepID=A0A0M6WVT5_9FIRM|nr:replication initiator A domain-containing protein [Roseburia inulinivorans]
MGGTIKFDYYYGIEADQFSFYRVPRMLIKDERFKGLSSDAKLLYGLMLDRMSLSMKNGWLDDENRAYIIYTVDAIMEDLGCGKDKAIKVLAELDTNKGIGLVERIRRGLGKPDIIYVKNFVVSQETEEKTDKMQVDSDTLAEVGDADLQKSEKPNSRSLRSRLQEVGKIEFRNSENQTSRGGQNGLQEVGNSVPIYTNYNQTDQNYTDMNNINPINQSESEQKKPDSMDGMEDVNAYIELIKENIEYEHHMKYADWQDKALYEELFEVICEIVCVKRTTVKVAGEDYPYELVKSKFLKLDSGHLEYVMGCMKNTTTKIANIKSYMVTALYNAPSTINHYYQQEVQHDMYGGGWHEKGIV